MSFASSRISAALETAKSIDPQEYADARRASMWTAILTLVRLPLARDRRMALQEREKLASLLLDLAEMELSSEFIRKHMTPMVKMLHGDFDDIVRECLNEEKK